MTEYTPTTSWVRIMVGYAAATAVDRTLPIEVARVEGYQWFDRWLAAHDAEVRAEALEEVANEWADKNGMSWLSMQARWLRTRAAEIREGRA